MLISQAALFVNNFHLTLYLAILRQIDSKVLMKECDQCIYSVVFQMLRTSEVGTSLAAQWLKLHAPNAGGPGLTLGRGTRSHMHAATKSSHAATKEPVSCN